MRRDPDATTLVTGLLAMALGIGHLLDDAGVVALSAGWMLPVALLGTGVAGLVRAVHRARG